MVPKCAFEPEKSARFTLHSVRSLGPRPPGTRAQGASPLPQHLKRCDLAEGCVLTVACLAEERETGEKFWEQLALKIRLYLRDSEVMIATWMLFSLFTVGLLGH